MKAKFLVACAALVMLLPLTGFSAAGAEAERIKAGKLPMLAKAGASDSEIAERFELYVNGVELANGFSELCDPAEQNLEGAHQDREERGA